MGKSVTIASEVTALRSHVNRWRRDGHTTAIVPTMGGLHDGHLSLVKKAQTKADFVAVSIFVNPTQFAEGEDFSTYPGDLDEDLQKLEACGANLAYVPNAGEMYPDGFSTTVHVNGPAMAGLEDKFRPHFFDGVATVVAKLLIQAQCDYAIFGEKDYQQLAVVTQLTNDLNIPTQIIGSKTIRETSGLAMSSRNAYLSETERARAALIYECLEAAAKDIRADKNIADTMSKARTKLTENGYKVDYVEARNAKDLSEVKSSDAGPLRLLCAAWLGKTRLIDNIAV